MARRILTAWAFVAALGCYSAWTPEGDDGGGDRDATDAARDDAGFDAAADVPAEADAEADAPFTCPPATSVDVSEIIRDPWGYAEETVWVHGYFGAIAGACTSMACVDDACCNRCEWSAVLRAYRYDGLFSRDGLPLTWWPGPPPDCEGDECHVACRPWGTGTELWVRAVIRNTVETGLYGEVLDVCPGEASSPTGTYRVTLRGPDAERCPPDGGASLAGMGATFAFWLEGDGARGEMWVDPISATPPELRGTFDGTTLRLHDPRLCDPCSCVFDVEATFPDSGSIVGRAYIEAMCACVAAFSFEGLKTSDDVVRPGG